MKFGWRKFLQNFLVKNNKENNKNQYKLCVSPKEIPSELNTFMCNICQFHTTRTHTSALECVHIPRESVR